MSMSVSKSIVYGPVFVGQENWSFPAQQKLSSHIIKAHTHNDDNDNDDEWWLYFRHSAQAAQ